MVLQPLTFRRETEYVANKLKIVLLWTYVTQGVCPLLHLFWLQGSRYLRDQDEDAGSGAYVTL